MDFVTKRYVHLKRECHIKREFVVINLQQCFKRNYE